MAYPKVLIDGREYIPRLAPAIHETETLAQYLTFLRKEAGLGVGDVEALTGIRSYRLELWEENAAGIPFNEAVLLCRVYGISTDLLALRVLAEVDPVAPDSRPIATHFDHQGSAKVARIRDPLRQEPPQSQIKIDPPPTAVEPEPVVLEVDVEEDDFVTLTEDNFIHYPADFVCLDTDDSDDYIDGDEPEEVTRDTSKAKVGDTNPQPEEPVEPDAPATQSERLRDVLDALL